MNKVVTINQFHDVIIENQKVFHRYYCNLPNLPDEYGYLDGRNISLCPHFFMNNYDLNIHRREHIEQSVICNSLHTHIPLKCSMCSLEFHELGDFKGHQYLHKIGYFRPFKLTNDCPIHAIGCIGTKTPLGIRILCPKVHAYGKIVTHDITGMMRKMNRRAEIFHEMK